MVDELWHPDGTGGARHDFWSGGEAGRDPSLDPAGEQVADALGGDDDDDVLPEHERDDDRTIGGGIMDRGGTAIERGGDTIDHEAPPGEQGKRVERDDEPVPPPVEPGGSQ